MKETSKSLNCLVPWLFLGHWSLEEDFLVFADFILYNYFSYTYTIDNS